MMTRENTPVLDAELIPAVTAAPQEVLVADTREGLTPSQMVERKLATLLRSTPLSVSQLQTAGTRRTLS